jgi:hypothetical protein
MLTNTQAPAADGNFCDEHGSAIKPTIVADYNMHVGHVDNADRMTNSYSTFGVKWKMSDSNGPTRSKRICTDSMKGGERKYAYKRLFCEIIDVMCQNVSAIFS